MANQVLYGFVNLQNIYDQRITSANIPIVTTAITRTLEEHDRQMAATLELFARPTTLYSERFRTGSQARLQPLDEQGRARPIRIGGYADVAYPLQGAGSAWGTTFRGRAKMTVQEVAEVVATQLVADRRWNRDHILAALFGNVNWTYTDDQYGALTIKPLANSDAQTYTILTGADAGTTDSHYAAQAAAIASATDPFPALYDDLVEHPENGPTVVAFVPTSNKAACQGLADFVDVNDSNLLLGSGSDRLVATLGARIPGQIFGYHRARVWLAEWRALPADYVIGVTTDGEPPLAMRQEPEAELQGFRLVAERPDYPFYESQWVRVAGYGARNRVGAYVARVGNGTYAIPTGYTSPMP